MFLTLMGGFIAVSMVCGWVYLMLLTFWVRVLSIKDLFTYSALMLLGWNISAYMSPKYHYSTLEGIGYVCMWLLCAMLAINILPRILNGATIVFAVVVGILHGVISWWWNIPYWSTVLYTFGSIIAAVVLLFLAAVCYQKVFTKKEN